jgi:hypothetical protein
VFCKVQEKSKEHRPSLSWSLHFAGCCSEV